jgi:ribosomal protein S18 acetylase RimI-like enzyme
MRVRDATIADVAELGRMLRLLAVDQNHPMALDAIAHVLVAERRGKVCGTIGLMPPVNGRAQIVDLWVDEACRRKGIGTALLNAAERMARSFGADVTFYHSPENDVASRFYESVGFAREPA